MKPSAFFFCCFALLRLGMAQDACTFDVALPYSVQGGPGDSSGSSNGSSGSSNGSAGTSNGSAGTSNGSAGTSDGSSGTSDGSSGTSDGSSGTSDGSAGISDGFSAAGDISTIDSTLAESSALTDVANASSDLLKNSVKARALQLGQLMGKRAGFTCTEQETCYSVNNGLFCANGRNGDFHEPDGTVGNLNTGNYTLANGRQGNLYYGPRPELDGDSTPTASVSNSTGDSTPTASVLESAGESSLAASRSQSVAVTATTDGNGAATSQATGTESRRPTTASPTSSTTTTSSDSSTPQPASSASGASTSSSAAPGSGASCLQFPISTIVAMISIITGSWLWRIFLL